MKNPCAFSSLKKKRSEVWRSILGFGVQTGVCLAHCQYQAKGEGEGGTIIQKWRECSLYLLGVKKRVFSLTKSRVGVFAVPLRVLDQKRIDRKQCVLCCFSHGNRTGPWYFLAEYQAFLTPDLLLRKAWYSLVRYFFEVLLIISDKHPHSFYMGVQPTPGLKLCVLTHSTWCLISAHHSTSRQKTRCIWITPRVRTSW